MPRKDNDNNPLQLRVRAVSLPKRVTPRQFTQRLIQFITTGKPLPRSWEVVLQWRNPKTHHGVTKRWREDDFESAVMESRSGFNSILLGALQQRLRRF